MEIEAVERQVGAEALLLQLHRGAPLLHEDAPGFAGRGFWLESRTSLWNTAVSPQLRLKHEIGQSF